MKIPRFDKISVAMSHSRQLIIGKGHKANRSLNVTWRQYG